MGGAGGGGAGVGEFCVSGVAALAGAELGGGKEFCGVVPEGCHPSTKLSEDFDESSGSLFLYGYQPGKSAICAKLVTRCGNASTIGIGAGVGSDLQRV